MPLLGRRGTNASRCEPSTVWERPAAPAATGGGVTTMGTCGAASWAALLELGTAPAGPSFIERRKLQARRGQGQYSAFNYPSRADLVSRHSPALAAWSSLKAACTVSVAPAVRARGVSHWYFVSGLEGHTNSS